MKTASRKRPVSARRAALLAACFWLGASGGRAQEPPPLPPLPGDIVVTITSPPPDAVVTGSVPVSASVTPLGAPIADLQFKLDGRELGTPDSSRPYAVTWDSKGARNGRHVLAAVARTSMGLQFSSAPVTVTVANEPPADTTPPTVALTAPHSGATVSGTIVVSASAADEGGVAGVQFMVDGDDLGMDTAAPYEMTWNTTEVANGAHTLTALAQDAAGNVGDAKPVAILVANGPLDSATPSIKTRLEETAATLTPSSARTEMNSVWAGATLSGGRAAGASTPGARAGIDFTGRSVSWIGLPCEVCGLAKVYLDGALAATIDTYAPERPPASIEMFDSGELNSGNHSLIIEVTGGHKAAAAGSHVIVDAFDVE